MTQVLTAVKGNVQLTLDNPAEIDGYSKQGYDIYEGKELLKPAANKKISYEEHLAALAGVRDGKKSKELKAQVAELTAANKALVSENTELKAQLEGFGDNLE